MKRCLVLALVLLFSACSAPAMRMPEMHSAAPPSDVPPNTVVINNFAFTPPSLIIAPGTTITWMNHDDVPHTVTSDRDPRTLDSPVLDTDGKYTFTFNTPGKYDYYCTVHPHMTGTVIVK